MVRVTAPVFLLQALLVANGKDVTAGCSTGECAEDSSLLSVKKATAATRALLSRRDSIESPFCTDYFKVCDVLPLAETKKECDFKKTYKSACESTYSGKKTTAQKDCLKLEDKMKKSCQDKVKTGEWCNDDCMATLDVNYDCTNFCFAFAGEVCPEISGDCGETKKTCKDIEKNGKSQCETTFPKPPKGTKYINDLQKTCKNLMKPMRKSCEDVLKENKKSGGNMSFTQTECEDVLGLNYEC